MSSNTWTPSAVASSAFSFEGPIWRCVEGQHQIATLTLVDTLEEQADLERLLESTKPPIPSEARKLHWLLATPFRYPPSLHGSRFRAPHDPGVFYGADEVRTACAEISYWRWRFLMDSPALKSLDARPQTIFSTGIKANSVDLKVQPFAQSSDTWTHPTDYAGTQRFARMAREANIDAIRYRSVRDQIPSLCMAVLEPRAFAQTSPLEAQSWLLSVTHTRAFWHREPLIYAERFEFDVSVWSH